MSVYFVCTTYNIKVNKYIKKFLTVTPETHDISWARG